MRSQRLRTSSASLELASGELSYQQAAEKTAYALIEPVRPGSARDSARWLDLDTPGELPKTPGSVPKRFVVVLFAVAAIMLRGGTGETVETALHLAAHGHAAHAVSDRDAASDHGVPHSDLEHGCSGHFHVCPCCAHPVMANAALAFVVPPAPDSSERLTLALTRAGPEGTSALLFRPPIAS